MCKIFLAKRADKNLREGAAGDDICHVSVNLKRTPLYIGTYE